MEAGRLTDNEKLLAGRWHDCPPIPDSLHRLVEIMRSRVFILQPITAFALLALSAAISSWAWASGVAFGVVGVGILAGQLLVLSMAWFGWREHQQVLAKIQSVLSEAQEGRLESRVILVPQGQALGALTCSLNGVMEASGRKWTSSAADAPQPTGTL
jgi:hypothetical protein